MLCLDNDVLRKYARPEPDENVVSYLAGHSSEPWIVPSVVLFEYLQHFEAQHRISNERQQIETTFDAVAPMNAAVAEEAANLRARLAEAGTSLDVPDLLVAATARTEGATLATANKNDFDKTPIHELLTVDIVPTS
jgi:predicted nucleic acid-binding protein